MRALQEREDRGDGAARADHGIISFRGLCRLKVDPEDAAARWTLGATGGNAICVKLLAETSAPGASIGAPLARSAPLPSRVRAQNSKRLEAVDAIDKRNDAARAIKLYEECAAGPSDVLRARALYGLALIYSQGQGGQLSDPGRARAYLRAAADAAVASGVAGEPRAATTEAEMLSMLVQRDITDCSDSDGLGEDPTTPLRSSFLCRTLPLITRAWGLDPSQVSTFLSAMLAVGYAVGAGAPCDPDKALLWVERSFSSLPPVDHYMRAAVDARQNDALGALQKAPTHLASKPESAPLLPRFNEAVRLLHVRIAKTWAGSRTNTMRTAAFWLARKALEDAHAGRDTFAAARTALELAADEGVGCAAHMLYTAFYEGAHGAEPCPAAAARWAARCHALGHGMGSCDASGDD